MTVNFRDHGYPLRQAWINEGLQAKLDLLRLRYHARGKFFVGEETLARRLGGKTYDVKLKTWINKS